ncbi:hypothetical protein D9M69_651400 [compost metagenome]
MTVFDSPGFSDTRWKPRRLRTGRVIEATSSRTYSCTTSSPSRWPLLVTVTLTCCLPCVPMRGCASLRSLYLKLV